MLNRIKMPDQRSGTTQKATVGAWEIYVTVNFYENSQPGEVFVKVGKEGSVISGLMQVIATQFSMMLQCGVPMDRITAKMNHHQFEPSDEASSSIADLLANVVQSICSDWGSHTSQDHTMQEVKW